MDRSHRLRRSFRYDRWANREILAALAGPAGAPGKTLAVLAHVVGAEQLWLSRLQSAAAAIAVWPELSVERCRAELDRLEKAWDLWFDALPLDALGREVAYVNSKGEPWKSTVADVLDHVLLHSSYHRGQIAAELRASGRVPPYTDFIHAVRNGLVG